MPARCAAQTPIQDSSSCPLIDPHCLAPWTTVGWSCGRPVRARRPRDPSRLSTRIRQRARASSGPSRYRAAAVRPPASEATRERDRRPDCRCAAGSSSMGKAVQCSDSCAALQCRRPRCCRAWPSARAPARQREPGRLAAGQPGPGRWSLPRSRPRFQQPSVTSRRRPPPQPRPARS